MSGRKVTTFETLADDALDYATVCCKILSNEGFLISNVRLQNVSEPFPLQKIDMIRHKEHIN